MNDKQATIFTWTLLSLFILVACVNQWNDMKKVWNKATSQVEVKK